ncbi:MAG: hypothetical protein FWG68_08005 [Defluviitaleaceae bacterium]|nr:hypothetical protein [Defluviitaleaceae bacterium]
MTKKIIIILLASITVVGGAAAAFGPNLARDFVPQFFIARAVLNTAQDFLPFLDAVRVILPQVQSQPLQLESSTGINRVGGELAENIPAAILPALQLLSIRNTTRIDSGWDNLANNLNVQMAATSLLETDIMLNRQQLLVNIPMVFDFDIMLDPRRIGSELNESALVGMVLPANLIDDNLFYYFYSQLFIQRRQIDVQGLINAALAMAAGATFEHIGIGGNSNENVFRVILPVAAANNTVNFVLPGTTFTEDPVIDLGITGNRLSFASGVLSVNLNGAILPIYAELFFTDIGAISYETLFPEGTISGTLAVSEQPDHNALNFTTHVTAPDLTAIASGAARLFPQQPWQIEGSFSNLTLITPNIDIAINTNYTLQADNQPIIFNTAEARTLAQLGIFDLLGGMARLSESPVGALLGDLILP